MGKEAVKKTKKKHGAREIREGIMSFLMLTVGAITAAFALEEFLAPNSILDGGVVGVAMILEHFLPIKLGFLIAGLNVPFVILALWVLGPKFVLKFGYSVSLFSIMTGVFEPLQNVTEDTILAVAFGGVLLGVGVGLVLRGGGCLDGTEILAVILNRNVSFSVGQIILIFNVVIYFVAGLVFGMDHGMYSLLMYIITSRIIDIVEIGGEAAFSVMIISENGRELAERIYHDLGRTVTFLRGYGYISSEEKDVLYCVVTRVELVAMKQIIEEVPGSTFTTISEVEEIVGNHIKARKETRPENAIHNGSLEESEG